VLALIHDVILMFALTVICRVQINSSYVAAMITIIAYSINNTIIIFDRCREYMKPLKGMKNIDYDAIGDTSVRENMRRSVFTTATTMVLIHMVLLNLAECFFTPYACSVYFPLHKRISFFFSSDKPNSVKLGLCR